MIHSAWELIEPSAVPCIQGPQKAVAAMSAFQGYPIQICTIIYDPEKSDIHLISDDSCSLPASTLSNLRRFLSLELSTQSEIVENGDDEDQLDTDEEEILDGNDCLVDLENELEQMAVNDPDVIELTTQLKTADVVVMSTNEEEESLFNIGDSGRQCMNENLTLLSVEQQTNEKDFMDIWEEVPEDSETRSLVEPKALTLEEEPMTEMNVDYDQNSSTDFVVEKVKRRRTRQVLDYVQVPPLVALPRHQIHSSKSSEEELALRIAGTTAPRGEGQTKRKKRLRSASPASANTLYPFVLTEEERSKTPKPHSPRDTPDAYLKWTFYIDLARVPGREPPPSFQTGKVSKQIDRPPVEQNTNTTAPATNELIPDDDLQSINCVYLSDYNLIICRNLHNGKPCGYGVPLANLFSHCFALDALSSLHTCERGRHRIDFCKRYDSRGGKSPYSCRQRSFLHRILSNHPNVIATMKEMRSIRMREDQFGAIQYLCPPVPGFACNSCEFAIHEVEGSEPLSMREHWLMHIKEDPQRAAHSPHITDLRRSGEFRRCKVQSFDRDQAHFLWLPVPPENPSRSAANPTKSFMQLLVSGSQSSGESAVTVNKSHLQLDSRSVLPFFVQNRAFHLISQLSPDYVVNLISLPGKKGDSGLFQKLKLATVQRFQRLCDEIPKVSTPVRKLLVVPKAGEKSLLESFNRPQQDSTIQSYALEETRLLLFILRCIQARRYSIGDLIDPISSTEGLWIGLTENQANCFQALLENLSEPAQDSPNLTLDSLIDAALRSVYMPNNSLEMFDNVFRNPATVYVILRSLRPQGGFLQAKEATVRYAPIQFGIRLTIMATVQDRYRELQAEKEKGENGEALYEELMKFAHDTITRWASLQHISPLGFVRECMKAMSRVARNMPANPTISWNADHSKITVQNHTVTIAEYLKQVQDSLSSLSRTVDEKILFGIEFPSQSFDLLDKSETNDIDTPGFGLFTIPTESDLQHNSDDHPAVFFLAQLCKAKGICTRQGDSIIWDVQRANEWLLDISEVWTETLTLMHLLAIPGRGTEVTTWQYTNTVTSPRHLFYSATLQTFVTQSGYNKTTAITGSHKHILRVIPFGLSLIITKLLRVVRPIELLAFTSLNGANTSRGHDTYSTYMFVSHGKVWDGNTLSASLRRWFSRALDVPFGLRLHRHFAQALLRQFLRYEKDDDLANIANEVMGHGREVADYNYAREGQDLSIDSTKRRRMEIVGCDWVSKVHGVGVSLEDKAE